MHDLDRQIEQVDEKSRDIVLLGGDSDCMIFFSDDVSCCHTVDGKKILQTSWYGKYPIICRVSYMSTVPPVKKMSRKDLSRPSENYALSLWSTETWISKALVHIQKFFRDMLKVEAPTYKLMVNKKTVGQQVEILSLLKKPEAKWKIPWIHPVAFFFFRFLRHQQ